MPLGKRGDSNLIYVAEIFGPTIQGEGPNVGMKSIFVRVAGCDFKCDWCDSKFAWSTEGAMNYTEDELVARIILKCTATNTNHVILTGGNPCIYNFSTVIDELHQNSITVDVETQGSLYPKWLNKVDLLVVSPKAPSSKMPDVYAGLNNYLLDRCQEMDSKSKRVAVKIPVFDSTDFEFAKRYYELVDKYRQLGCNIDLYLSVGNTDVKEEGDISDRILLSYKQLIENVCNSDMKRVFILPQVHTLVWGNKQGV